MSFTVWLTGLPCSGKTTIAEELVKQLHKKGVAVEHLDGDVLRKGLSSDLGFSKEDRNENIRRVRHLAAILNRNKVPVITSFVSPYREARNQARALCSNFLEVYVECSVEECEKRDVKGMYAKARKGEIKNFTGIDDPYEAPTNPEITVDTQSESVEESVTKILAALESFIKTE